MDYFVTRIEIECSVGCEHAGDSSWGSLELFCKNTISGHFSTGKGLEYLVELLGERGYGRGG